MNQLIFAPAAIADLQEIHAYIANDNLPAAEKFINRLQKRCLDLSFHPGAGTKRVGLLHGMRSATEGDYVIFYLELPDGVEVVRIVHGKRDLKSLFRQEN